MIVGLAGIRWSLNLTIDLLTVIEPTATFAVALDFETKTENRIEPDQIPEIISSGKFVWIDLDNSDPSSARETLAKLPGLSDSVIQDALRHDPNTALHHLLDSIHLVMTECTFADHDFLSQPVTVVIAKEFLLTVHNGPARITEDLRKHYSHDFQTFAKTPSFLLYHLWHALIVEYQNVQQQFEDEVERVQELMQGEVEDTIFARVSELGADLLRFRKVLLPARAGLTDMSEHRSAFVSESTQPFLRNMVATLDRVLHELLVDREILSDTMNLHMSAVAHRTNNVISRLTVLSFIFLPLTFLCGLWGMNFTVMPELDWEYGYIMFWVLAAGIVAIQLAVLRLKNLL